MFFMNVIQKSKTEILLKINKKFGIGKLTTIDKGD